MLSVQFFGLCLHAFEDVLRLLAAQHENDAFDGIVILLKAELTEPRRMADGDLANVAYANGHALLLPTTMFPMSSVLRTRPMPRT